MQFCLTFLWKLLLRVCIITMFITQFLWNSRTSNKKLTNIDLILKSALWCINIIIINVAETFYGSEKIDCIYKYFLMTVWSIN